MIKKYVDNNSSRVFSSIIKKKLFVQTQLGLKYELKLDVDDEIKSINRKPKTDLPLCKER